MGSKMRAEAEAKTLVGGRRNARERREEKNKCRRNYGVNISSGRPTVQLLGRERRSPPAPRPTPHCPANHQPARNSRSNHPITVKSFPR